MKLNEIMYPVKIGKGLKKAGFPNDYYLYQKSDREVLIDYKTKREAKVAKEMHDWIRGNFVEINKLNKKNK